MKIPCKACKAANTGTSKTLSFRCSHSHIHTHIHTHRQLNIIDPFVIPGSAAPPSGSCLYAVDLLFLAEGYRHLQPRLLASRSGSKGECCGASSPPHQATLSPVQRGRHELLKYQIRLKVIIAGCSRIGLPAFPSLIFLTALSPRTPAKTFDCQPPGSNSDDIAVITPHSAVATSPLSHVCFNSLHIHFATWVKRTFIKPFCPTLSLSSTIHLQLIKNVCLLWRSLSPLT